MGAAAIYARVSSARQREEETIASQTAALVAHAEQQGLEVPPEWIFEDEGYSGATLVRPALERLRDLAAQVGVDVVYCYSPDRLARNYAYQVLLLEEFARAGTEVRFVHGPKADTPEDTLLVQFQGMIAEYERAQIAERTRRGKAHRARAGVVNVLGGAPYGYRYIRRSDDADARYEIAEQQAAAVRALFDRYVDDGVSIGELARWLTEQGIPTSSGKARWDRSTIWGMLHNPAYVGRAAFLKTGRASGRPAVTRTVRLKGQAASRHPATRPRPHEEWIEIPVPALVDEETFSFAQEQLEKNRHYARRRTIEPTLLQGMLVCRDCGYALYRTSTRTAARKLYYYRCLGSDAYRHLRGALCANRPVRQDYLDGFVWRELVRLLEEPALVQAEIDRRLAEARVADPLRRREQSLRQQQVRLQNRIERLLTAYQEELLSLEQLRQRMPALRKQQQAVDAELQSLALAAADQSRYLRVTETLADFCAKLRARADMLEVTEKQKIARLLIQEVLVGGDTIIIRHSIPLFKPEPDGTRSSTPPATMPRDAAGDAGDYLLRSGSKVAVAQ